MTCVSVLEEEENPDSAFCGAIRISPSALKYPWKTMQDDSMLEEKEITAGKEKKKKKKKKLRRIEKEKEKKKEKKKKKEGGLGG